MVSPLNLELPSLQFDALWTKWVETHIVSLMSKVQGLEEEARRQSPLDVALRSAPSPPDVQSDHLPSSTSALPLSTSTASFTLLARMFEKGHMQAVHPALLVVTTRTKAGRLELHLAAVTARSHNGVEGPHVERNEGKQQQSLTRHVLLQRFPCTSPPDADDPCSAVLQLLADGVLTPLQFSSVEGEAYESTQSYLERETKSDYDQRTEKMKTRQVRVMSHVGVYECTQPVPVSTAGMEELRKSVAVRVVLRAASGGLMKVEQPRPPEDKSVKQDASKGKKANTKAKRVTREAEEADDEPASRKEYRHVAVLRADTKYRLKLLGGEGDELMQMAILWTGAGSAAEAGHMKKERTKRVKKCVLPIVTGCHDEDDDDDDDDEDHDGGEPPRKRRKDNGKEEKRPKSPQSSSAVSSSSGGRRSTSASSSSSSGSRGVRMATMVRSAVFSRFGTAAGGRGGERGSVSNSAGAAAALLDMRARMRYSHVARLRGQTTSVSSGGCPPPSSVRREEVTVSVVWHQGALTLLVQQMGLLTAIRSPPVSRPGDCGAFAVFLHRLTSFLSYPTAVNPPWLPHSQGRVDRSGWIGRLLASTAESRAWDVHDFLSTPLLELSLTAHLVLSERQQRAAAGQDNRGSEAGPLSRAPAHHRTAASSPSAPPPARLSIASPCTQDSASPKAEGTVTSDSGEFDGTISARRHPPPLCPPSPGVAAATSSATTAITTSDSPADGALSLEMSRATPLPPSSLDAESDHLTSPVSLAESGGELNDWMGRLRSASHLRSQPAASHEEQPIAAAPPGCHRPSTSPLPDESYLVALAPIAWSPFSLLGAESDHLTSPDCTSSTLGLYDDLKFPDVNEQADGDNSHRCPKSDLNASWMDLCSASPAAHSGNFFDSASPPLSISSKSFMLSDRLFAGGHMQGLLPALLVATTRTKLGCLELHLVAVKAFTQRGVDGPYVERVEGKQQRLAPPVLLQRFLCTSPPNPEDPCSAVLQLLADGVYEPLRFHPVEDKEYERTQSYKRIVARHHVGADQRTQPVPVTAEGVEERTRGLEVSVVLQAARGSVRVHQPCPSRMHTSKKQRRRTTAEDAAADQAPSRKRHYASLLAGMEYQVQVLGGVDGELMQLFLLWTGAGSAEEEAARTQRIKKLVLIDNCARQEQTDVNYTDHFEHRMPHHSSPPLPFPRSEMEVAQLRAQLVSVTISTVEERKGTREVMEVPSDDSDTASIVSCHRCQEAKDSQEVMVCNSANGKCRRNYCRSCLQAWHSHAPAAAAERGALSTAQAKFYQVNGAVTEMGEIYQWWQPDHRKVWRCPACMGCCHCQTCQSEYRDCLIVQHQSIEREDERMAVQEEAAKRFRAEQLRAHHQQQSQSPVLSGSIPFLPSPHHDLPTLRRTWEESTSSSMLMYAGAPHGKDSLSLSSSQPAYSLSPTGRGPHSSSASPSSFASCYPTSSTISGYPHFLSPSPSFWNPPSPPVPTVPHPSDSRHFTVPDEVIASEYARIVYPALLAVTIVGGDGRLHMHAAPVRAVNVKSVDTHLKEAGEDGLLLERVASPANPDDYSSVLPFIADTTSDRYSFKFHRVPDRSFTRTAPLCVGEGEMTNHLGLSKVTWKGVMDRREHRDLRHLHRLDRGPLPVEVSAADIRTLSMQAEVRVVIRPTRGPIVVVPPSAQSLPLPRTGAREQHRQYAVLQVGMKYGVAVLGGTGGRVVQVAVLWAAPGRATPGSSEHETHRLQWVLKDVLINNLLPPPPTAALLDTFAPLDGST